MNKLTKTIILFILAIIGSLVFGYGSKIIFSQSFSWPAASIIFIIILCLASALWAMSIFLIDNKYLGYLISIFYTVILLFFYPLQNPYYWVALLILLFSLLLAVNIINKEKSARVKIMLDEITNPGIKIILGAFCLILALNYYYSPVSSKLDVSVPVKYQDKLMDYLIPGFNSNLTVDDFVWQTMIISDKSSQDNAQRSLILIEKKGTTTPEQFADYKQALFEKLELNKFNLTGAELVKNTPIVSYLLQELPNQYFARYLNFLRLVGTIVFFFTINWIGKILAPLVYLLVWLIYQILAKVNFFKISNHQVNAEKIEL